MNKKNMRHRRYILTINNPSEGWQDATRSALSQMILAYWCFSMEIGLEEQTPHVHVYFASKTSAIRFSTVKGLFPTAHIEPAQGSSTVCRAYIRKDGVWAEGKKADTSVPDTFEEWGELPIEHQGQRSDWDIAYDMLAEGQSVLDVIRAQTHLMRYRSPLEQTRQELISEQFRDTFRILETTYIYGLTNLGKTRYVMEKYGYSNVYKLSGYLHGCFDMYQCEDVIAYDEYNSSIKIQDMNNFLDGYPLTLPCRYSNKVACYTKAYIISNIPLEYQYPNVRIENREVWDAFIRRIHKVIIFTGVNQYEEMTTQEYFNQIKRFGWIEVSDTGDFPFREGTLL